VRRMTLDLTALARKAGAFHERREVASALQPGRMCARVQEINAGERLPNCARMIVEEIHAWEEWRTPNWVPFQFGLERRILIK
jgi:hypothetical protein